ncbi:hypothetical protein L9F63_015807 [Diploptera punctata]|uniref:Mitochondrial import receptor subunit TOM22 homolog n=1 Tax=Diploptera punctata TaxID=6984 RepID=A0AAD8A4X5_DIPPU|nr:hypothetical protein L9F63_015807 [Diploptera punctata]
MPKDTGKQTEDEFDDDLEETLIERLWGLSEMFPETVRNITCTVVTGSFIGLHGLYNASCQFTRIFFASSVILFAPLIVEIDRAQMIENQRSQQKQVLLGQGNAASGGLSIMSQIQ